MNKKLSFESFKKEAMKDEKFKVEYKLLHSEFELVRQAIKSRIEANKSE